MPIKYWLLKKLPHKIKHVFDICTARTGDTKINMYMRNCLVKLWLNAIKRNCYNLSFQLIFTHRAIWRTQTRDGRKTRKCSRVTFQSKGIVHENRIDRSMMRRGRRISFSSLNELNELKSRVRYVCAPIIVNNSIFNVYLQLAASAKKRPKWWWRLWWETERSNWQHLIASFDCKNNIRFRC